MAPRCACGRTARASTTCARTSRWLSACRPSKSSSRTCRAPVAMGTTARIARSANGRPVRAQWSRADELAWSPVGAAMAVDVEADLDAEGTIVGWRHDVWSNGHTLRPGRAKTPALLGGWHLAKPFERM